MILYFLMEKAKGTEFTKKLGDSAYIFWKDAEIKELLTISGLKLLKILNLDYADLYICEAL